MVNSDLMAEFISVYMSSLKVSLAYRLNNG